jgi:hypothetical protein
VVGKKDIRLGLVQEGVDKEGGYRGILEITY